MLNAMTVISSMGAVVTAVAVPLGAALWAWAPQHADIPDPGPSATPEQVVQTYLQAVTVRDFDTANALVLARHLRYGRLDPAPRYTDLQVEPVDGGSSESSSEFTEVARVAAACRRDGAQQASHREYTLVRSADRGWRIVDSVAA